MFTNQFADQVSGQLARLKHPRRGDTDYVMALNQGTTSTRCIIFDANGQIASQSQLEHKQYFPQPGWVEHDPEEIRLNIRRVMADAAASEDIHPEAIAAVGLTNQRETAIVWDRATGEPVYNAIVWQDSRTSDIIDSLTDEDKELIRDRTGLPASTYFAGPKIRWILDNVPGVRERAERGELVCGPIDTWVVWELTRSSRKPTKRGNAKARHVTDVTNASRTMLMDLRTQQWDEELCELFDIPMAMLPEIVSSSEVIGKVRRSGPATGVPIAGNLGDQQAAAFGQACLSPGDAKSTYGTGSFLLLNTGKEPQASDHGLITTIAYRLGKQPAQYALEGSIAVTGSLVQWLRDSLGFFDSADQIEGIARSVDDNGGCYIVPAFSGLLAPRWRPDARGVITGLTRYVTKAHMCRAALEATAFQTREVVDAMNADSGVPLTTLKADGGMVVNQLLMQFQADQLGVPVIIPKITETTALGAAYAAGLAVGVYEDEDAIRAMWEEQQTYKPKASKSEREDAYRMWNKAVERTLNWKG